MVYYIVDRGERSSYTLRVTSTHVSAAARPALLADQTTASVVYSANGLNSRDRKNGPLFLRPISMTFDWKRPAGVWTAVRLWA